MTRYCVGSDQGRQAHPGQLQPRRGHGGGYGRRLSGLEEDAPDGLGSACARQDHGPRYSSRMPRMADQRGTEITTERVSADLYFDSLLDALRAVADLQLAGYRTRLDELHDDPAFVEATGDVESYFVKAWRDVPAGCDQEKVFDEIARRVQPIADEHDGFLYELGYE
jgi:hypothetical protein